MKPVNNSFSIVLIGSWNPGIFTQADWVIENLIEDREQTVEIAMPLNDPNNTPRIAFEDQNIFVNAGSLTIIPKHQTVEGLKKSAALAEKILLLLTHTPISKCGVNFSFSIDVDDKTNSLTQALLASDESDLLVNSSGRMISKVVERSIEIKDSVLNLRIAEHNNLVEMRFNYHHETGSNSQFRTMLANSNDAIDRYFKLATDICQSVYELELETN